jgi:hypothetical protein
MSVECETCGKVLSDEEQFDHWHCNTDGAVLLLKETKKNPDGTWASDQYVCPRNPKHTLAFYLSEIGELSELDNTSETATRIEVRSSGGSVWCGSIELPEEAFQALIDKLLAIRIPTARPSVDLKIEPVKSFTTRIADRAVSSVLVE